MATDTWRQLQKFFNLYDSDMILILNDLRFAYSKKQVHWNFDCRQQIVW